MKTSRMMNSANLFGEISKEDYVAYVKSVGTIQTKGRSIVGGKQPETYTERLLSDQNERIKKLGSEVMELIAEDGSPASDIRALVCEAADTVYTTEVLLAARGVSIAKTIKALGLYWDNIVRVDPSERQRIMEMLVDQESRAKQLGSSAGFLVVAERAPNFDEQTFVIGALGVLNVTGVMLQAQGLSLAPVFAELGSRNSGAAGGVSNG